MALFYFIIFNLTEIVLNNKAGVSVMNRLTLE